jgi:hypothetical protein
MMRNVRHGVRYTTKHYNVDGELVIRYYPDWAAFASALVILLRQGFAVTTNFKDWDSTKS